METLEQPIDVTRSNMFKNTDITVKSDYVGIERRRNSRRKQFRNKLLHLLFTKEIYSFSERTKDFFKLVAMLYVPVLLIFLATIYEV